MLDSKANRRHGLYAMLGSLLWIANAVLSGDGGTRAEAIVRTVLLNPALLLLILGLMGFQQRQAKRSGWLGAAGSAICVLGASIMLLGNITEIWVYKYLHGVLEARWAPGWRAMGVGLLMLAAGFIALGIGSLRAGVFTGWRRAAPLGFGLMLALAVGALTMSYWSDSRAGYAAAINRIGPFITVWGIAIGWAAFGYALWSEKVGSPLGE